MKHFICLLLAFCFYPLAQAQTYVRQPIESIDSLVGRILNKNSSAGRIFEFALDSSSIVLYFEIRSASELADGDIRFGETITLFNVLYSEDRVHYSKYKIDTLGQSDGCWAPVRVDTMLLFNVDNDKNKEICLVASHTPFCDAYLEYAEILFFDDLASFLPLKTIVPLPALHCRFFEMPMPDPLLMEAKIREILKEKNVLKR